jgi:energy-coupling factor transporter ATP-binding protein EcfA2
VRGQLGLMLFSGDDGDKRLSALSGGEAARLVFSRLAIEQPNVLVLDEPTNHLDLESIEALVAGLLNYDGTVLLVSHDRWFVSRLATRVVEIRPDGIRDYHGPYADYVHACGDDHLDADTVVLKARRAEKKTPATGIGRGRDSDGARDGSPQNSARRSSLEEGRSRITDQIEKAELRIAEIDEAFASPGYFAETPAEDIRLLQNERAQLQERVESWIEAWERLESELEAIPLT